MSTVRDVLKSAIRESVNSVYNIELTDVLVEHPENSDWGDYATNVALVLSKQLNQSPHEIAKKLSYELPEKMPKYPFFGREIEIISDTKIAGAGFINFTISHEWLKCVLHSINDLGSNYGSHNFGKGKKVILEFSQANSNKPQHVGHARNNFLGASLSRILSYCGYDVIRANYVGDIGIHICKSMLMYLKYANGSEPTKKSDHFVGDFYIKFEQDVEVNPDLLDEAQELLRRWESGDPEIIALWKKMNVWVYNGWQETYKNQGVVFDVWEYESEKVSIGKEIADLAVQKGIAVKDETGAIIAKLKENYGIPDKVLLRSDGTSLYSTKDLQLAKDSYDKYGFDKRLYVVDVRQSDYFRQIFKILDLLGFEWAKKLIHVAYGFVSLPEGNMSSRKGRVVNADDVFTTLETYEAEEIKTSAKDVADVQETIRKVSMCAFKYGLLKVDPKQDLVFDYAKVTKFEGNSGPYLMYTYARAASLLERANFDWDKDACIVEIENTNTASEKSEIALLRTLYMFDEVVSESAERLAPNLICNYLFELSHKFNAFYSEVNVMNSSAEQKYFRLLLTRSVKQVLNNGITLLGIETVDKM